MEKEQQAQAEKAQANPPERSQICGAIEAILYVTGEPIEASELSRALEVSEMELFGALDELEHLYDSEARGFRLLRFGEHVQLGTRSDYAPYIERLLQPVQKQSLSQAVMETLALIAYKQPVTRAEIEAIRGVKCDYSLQSLLGKHLVCEVGRKETLGRPILYGTTDEFLRHFCIASLSELPKVDLSAVTAKALDETGGSEGLAGLQGAPEKEES